MFLVRKKFTGRKHLIMKYGGMGTYALLILIAVIALFTSVKAKLTAAMEGT